MGAASRVEVLVNRCMACGRYEHELDDDEQLIEFDFGEDSHTGYRDAGELCSGCSPEREASGSKVGAKWE